VSRVVGGAIENSQNRLRALPGVLRGIVKIGSIIAKQAGEWFLTWFLTLTTLGSGAGFAYLAYKNEHHKTQDKMLPWSVASGLFGGLSLGFLGGLGLIKLAITFFDKLTSHRTVIGSSTVTPTNEISHQVRIPISTAAVTPPAPIPSKTNLGVAPAAASSSAPVANGPR
jgi:hypothetical protein